MDFKSLLQEGWHSFSSNPLRSALSVIGVIFGIASVIAMLNIGVGAEKQINAMLSAMGEHNLHIIAKDYDTKQWSTLVSKTNGLSYRDLQMVHEFSPQSISAPLLAIKLTSTIPKSADVFPTLFSISPDFILVTKFNFSAGRMFTSFENQRGIPAVILGSHIANLWFGSEPKRALDKDIRLNSSWFYVIGVLKSMQLNSSNQVSSSVQSKSKETESSNAIDSSLIDFDNSIFIPEYSATARIMPTPSVSQYSRIIVKLPNNEDPMRAQKLIQAAEDTLNRGEKVVDVVAAIQIIEQKKKTTNLFTYFLLSIASISLIVGGIGIANVMLASMQERIYEVGLRRAIGARKKDILFQFLMECIVICLFGGLLGTFIGIIGAIIVVKLTGWPVAFPWWSVVSAVGISVIVGILSGIYPAMKASSIDPVNALQGQAK